MPKNNESKFETGTSETGKGFYNLKVELASGKKVSLGGILDYAKLDDSARTLLNRLVAEAGARRLTIDVTYNAFGTKTELADDDFA
jgi:hypothetical protein